MRRYTEMIKKKYLKIKFIPCRYVDQGSNALPQPAEGTRASLLSPSSPSPSNALSFSACACNPYLPILARRGLPFCSLRY